jgi:hypothetical protein
MSKVWGLSTMTSCDQFDINKSQFGAMQNLLENQKPAVMLSKVYSYDGQGLMISMQWRGHFTLPFNPMMRL